MKSKSIAEEVKAANPQFSSSQARDVIVRMLPGQGEGDKRPTLQAIPHGVAFSCVSGHLYCFALVITLLAGAEAGTANSIHNPYQKSFSIKMSTCFFLLDSVGEAHAKSPTNPPRTLVFTIFSEVGEEMKAGGELCANKLFLSFFSSSWRRRERTFH